MLDYRKVERLKAKRDLEGLKDYLIEEIKESKDPQAYYELGYYYYRHDHKDVMKMKAIYNFEKAASLNQPQACVMLARMYETGFFLEEDLKKAFEYYKKAADLNFEAG